MLDYNLIENRYTPQQSDASTSYSLYGAAGFNPGIQRLRSDYSTTVMTVETEACSLIFYLPQTYLFPVDELETDAGPDVSQFRYF